MVTITYRTHAGEYTTVWRSLQGVQTWVNQGDCNKKREVFIYSEMRIGPILTAVQKRLTIINSTHFLK
jgi:hypothetical protein